MSKRARKAILSMLLWFWAGGVYFFIEVLWKTLRGRPDAISWTMFLLAIILAIPLERCGAEMKWETPLWVQGLVCGTAITAAELAAGLVLNVWLGLGVWDYSGLWGNFLGQVCPQFWLLWLHTQHRDPGLAALRRRGRGAAALQFLAEKGAFLWNCLLLSPSSACW